MEAQRDTARVALAQAVKERGAAEQAMAEANTARDRVDAETGSLAPGRRRAAAADLGPSTTSSPSAKPSRRHSTSKPRICATFWPGLPSSGTPPARRLADADRQRRARGCRSGGCAEGTWKRRSRRPWHSRRRTRPERPLPSDEAETAKQNHRGFERSGCGELTAAAATTEADAAKQETRCPRISRVRRSWTSRSRTTPAAAQKEADMRRGRRSMASRPANRGSGRAVAQREVEAAHRKDSAALEPADRGPKRLNWHGLQTRCGGADYRGTEASRSRSRRSEAQTVDAARERSSRHASQATDCEVEKARSRSGLRSATRRQLRAETAGGSEDGELRPSCKRLSGRPSR